MSRGLATLIRLHKRQADECRLRLSQAREAQDQITQARRRFEEQVVTEKQIAGQSLEASMTFDAWRKQSDLRRQQFEQLARQAAEQVRLAEDELAAAFQELKRYELALEEWQRQQAAEQAKAERIILDEIAGQRAQRRPQET